MLRAGRGVTTLSRYVTMLVCRDRCGASNAEIGASFGVVGSTVSSAVRRVRANMERDVECQKTYAELSDRLDEKPQDAT